MSLDLLKATDEQLDKMISDLGDDVKIDKRRKLERSEKIDEITRALIRKDETSKSQIRAELQVNARKTLGIDQSRNRARPFPETVAIQASKRVVAKFHNRENPATHDEPGADIEFDKGAFHFKLYDGHSYVLPEILVSETPLKCKDVFDKLVEFWMTPWKKQIPLSQADAEAMAQDVMRSVNLCYEDHSGQTPCTGPRYKKIKDDNAGENRLMSYDQKESRGFRRFQFIIQGEAPKGKAIGSFVE